MRDLEIAEKHEALHGRQERHAIHDVQDEDGLEENLRSPDTVTIQPMSRGRVVVA